MKAHVEEGDLQRLLDGEMEAGEAAGTRAHLGDCEPCRSRLDELRGTYALFSSRVTLLDPPPVSVEIAHADFRRRTRRAGGLTGIPHLRRAAVILLCVAGVASATVPGSPLREWLEGLRSDPSTGHAAGEPDIETSATDPGHASGVTVGSVDGEIHVTVEGASPELAIRVRMTDAPTLSIQGTGEAAASRFRMGRGRVTVEGATGGELRLSLPRGARLVSVTVDGRPILVKDGEDLHLFAPADTAGPEIVFPGRI